MYGAKPMVICGLIASRDRSEIYKVDYDGRIMCLKVIMDDQRFDITYEEAYTNYFAFKQTVQYQSGLFVDVHRAWRDEGGKFFILMEYLQPDLWERIEYGNRDTGILIAENLLMQAGFFMVDFAPINFLKCGKRIKMVDMDTLTRIDKYQEDPQEVIPELAWYGSRVLKYRKQG